MKELKHTILIATHQKDVRELLKTAFRKQEHNVHFSEDILDIVKKSEIVEISLILFDLNLLGANIFRPHSGEADSEEEIGFVVLRDCCGHIEMMRNHIRGNIELFFFKWNEVECMIEKINGLLKKLEPIIYKKMELREVGCVDYFQEIIGTSEKMEEVHNFIKKVAEKRIDVLIMGESGTGKELVARAVHSVSKDINRAFISINCAAIPGTLIESEIFGHEKGAFTGAIKRHLGKFELADGGTFFLDEIGDMNLDMQAKMLRAVESKEFNRLGGESLIHSDVRIISATNKDLLEEVAAGRFRQDLYYRLNVASVTLLPLRERKEDIPLLADHFMKKFVHEISSKVKYIAPETLSILLKYNWPGNIRELENCMKRAIAYSEHDAILPEHLPPCLLKYECTGKKKSLTEPLEELIHEYSIGEIPNNLLGSIENSLIPAILKKTGWNQKKTAWILGLAVNTLKRRLKENNIKRI